MAYRTYKWKEDYFYGYDANGMIPLMTYIESKAKKYNMIKNGSCEHTYRDALLYAFAGVKSEIKKEKNMPRDPDGEPMRYYIACVPQNETKPIEEYPGYYYWIWYNGEFFEVIGETEKYVLVDVLGVEHADALGIPREMVKGEYPDNLGVTRWWLKKKDIKMPDELGTGRYIYLKLGSFLKKVCEVVKRDGTRIRVRRRIKAYTSGMLRTRYEEIMRAIKMGTYPWSASYKMIKEIADMAEGDAWIEGEVIYCEATLDLEVLKKYKGKRDEYDWKILDYYWYGEEEVPYRL